MTFDKEKLVQALIRLVVVFVTAGLVAALACISVLQSAISDPVLASIVIAFGTALLQGILKFMGGPTEPVLPGVLGARLKVDELAPAANLAGIRRPSIFSI